MTVFLAIVAAVIVTVIVMNFSTGEKKIKRTIESLYATSDSQFVRAMGSLLGPALLSGNQVRQLLNGDEIFPAMLEAIRGAKSSITFETYIYWSGDIGQKFSEALSERARAGVKVHVLLDWVGAGKIDRTYIDSMKNAGVSVERYHPLRWYNVGRLNNRTHRKLLVIDGRIGFTGGVGIADNWLGHAESPDQEGLALSHRGAGGGRDAGSLSRQLAENQSRGSARGSILPADRTSGYTSGAGLQKLAGRGQ